MVIVHITIRNFGFKLMAKISSPYIRSILCLLSVWDYVPVFSLIVGRVAMHGSLDGDRVKFCASMRWTRGQPDL